MRSKQTKDRSEHGGEREKKENREMYGETEKDRRRWRKMKKRSARIIVV